MNALVARRFPNLHLHDKKGESAWQDSNQYP